MSNQETHGQSAPSPRRGWVKWCAAATALVLAALMAWLFAADGLRRGIWRTLSVATSDYPLSLLSEQPLLADTIYESVGVRGKRVMFGAVDGDGFERVACVSQDGQQLSDLIDTTKVLRCDAMYVKVSREDGSSIFGEGLGAVVLAPVDAHFTQSDGVMSLSLRGFRFIEYRGALFSLDERGREARVDIVTGRREPSGGGNSATQLRSLSVALDAVSPGARFDEDQAVINSVDISLAPCDAQGCAGSGASGENVSGIIGEIADYVTPARYLSSAGGLAKLSASVEYGGALPAYLRSKRVPVNEAVASLLRGSSRLEVLAPADKLMVANARGLPLSLLGTQPLVVRSLQHRDANNQIAAAAGANLYLDQDKLLSGRAWVFVSDFFERVSGALAASRHGEQERRRLRRLLGLVRAAFGVSGNLDARLSIEDGVVSLGVFDLFEFGAIRAVD